MRNREREPEKGPVTGPGQYPFQESLTGYELSSLFEWSALMSPYSRLATGGDPLRKGSKMVPEGTRRNRR